MVVPAGGAWLALHVLLLMMVASPWRMILSPALASPPPPPPSVASSWASLDNVTAHFSEEEQQQHQQHHYQQRHQYQADMPAGGYPEQGMESGEALRGGSMLADGASRHHPFQIEDIQVGCRELRAKRYISDGFCTSTKPIKEVVCAGNCLPIRDLPWYAEFVKVWAKSKLREWQCEEDIVRRKTVSLLCRNGDYRTYRIKVVKSCKCKRLVNKHNRTAASSASSSSPASSSGEGKKRKNKRKRKKDRRRRGRKNRRRGEKKNRRGGEEEKQEVKEEAEEGKVDVSQRQEGSNAQRKERRRNRKRPGQKKERNSEPEAGRGASSQDSLPRSDIDRHKPVADPSR